MAGNHLTVSGHMVRVSPKKVYLEDYPSFLALTLGPLCVHRQVVTTHTANAAELGATTAGKLCNKSDQNQIFTGPLKNILKIYNITTKSFFGNLYICSEYTVHLYVVLVVILFFR
jgi:hypothetical protein